MNPTLPTPYRHLDAATLAEFDAHGFVMRGAQCDIYVQPRILLRLLIETYSIDGNAHGLLHRRAEYEDAEEMRTGNWFENWVAQNRVYVDRMLAVA